MPIHWTGQKTQPGQQDKSIQLYEITHVGEPLFLRMGIRGVNHLVKSSELLQSTKKKHLSCQDTCQNQLNRKDELDWPEAEQIL